MRFDVRLGWGVGQRSWKICFDFGGKKLGHVESCQMQNLLEQEEVAQVLQYRQPADSPARWLGQVVFDYLSAADRNVTVGAQLVILV
jgi:hypothetical protein